MKNPVKIIFCKHEYPEWWSTKFCKDRVTFYKVCKKCGKRQEFTMPLYNVKPAWERYEYLKKQYLL